MIGKILKHMEIKPDTFWAIEVHSSAEMRAGK
jgi:hypothetical protein